MRDQASSAQLQNDPLAMESVPGSIKPSPLPPGLESFVAAVLPEAAERSLRPNRASGLSNEIIASELTEQQIARSGKRSAKNEDADDDAFYPGSSKRPKVAVDSVDAQDLAGNVFLRVDALQANTLVTFDGDLSRPLFFEERESGAVEIPAALLGGAVDALALKMPGIEVDLPDGTRRTATVQELITYLRWVFTNGEDPGPEPCFHSSLYGGSAAPAPVLMLIRCDEATAWLTFDINNLKAKAVVAKGAKMYELSPQQFELEAGCHARKWRNSFKVQAALKVIRQGVLTPAPYVELQAYLQRLLGLEGTESKAGKMLREASGAFMMPAGARFHVGGGMRAASPSPGRAIAAVPGAAATALLPPRAAALVAFGGMPQLAGMQSLNAAAAAAAAMAATTAAVGRAAPLPLPLPLPGPMRTGSSVPDTSAANVFARRTTTQPPPSSSSPQGVSGGPLSGAELQAIHAVVSVLDGPKLQWAVQGILQHVWKTHSCSGGTGGGAAGGSSGGGAGSEDGAEGAAAGGAVGSEGDAGGGDGGSPTGGAEAGAAAAASDDGGGCGFAEAQVEAVPIAAVAALAAAAAEATAALGGVGGSGVRVE